MNEYYKHLLSKALGEIDKLGGTAAMVCGNIGIGTENFEKNIKLIKNKIEELSKKENVFDQINYLDVFNENAPCLYGEKFEVFYKKLIQSGKINKLYVLRGFENSKGTLSEIEFAKEAKVPITFL